MSTDKVFGNVLVLIIKQLSVIRFSLPTFRCPLSVAVRCCPATDILCQLLLSSSELSLHGQLVRLAIVECRLSIANWHSACLRNY